MSIVVKILIISWVVVGYFIVGGVSFYLGRMTAPTQQQQQFQPQQYQPQPTGGLQQQPQQGSPTGQPQQFQGGQQPQQFGQPPTQQR